MARRRATLALAVIIVLAAGTMIVYAIGTSNKVTSPSPVPRLGEYRVVPTSWLVQGEMRFTRLNDSQVAQVKVSASTAKHVAEIGYAHGSRIRVVFESLGGYIDANQIVHDWVGTKSWIPPARPAYFVRLAGVDIPAIGVRAEVNHHVDVIVSAITGREICSVSFN
jgi:hypothetical protein